MTESIPAQYEVCNKCLFFGAWSKNKKHGDCMEIYCGAVPHYDEKGKSNDGKKKIGFIMGKFKKGDGEIPFKPCYNGVPKECPFKREHLFIIKESKA